MERSKCAALHEEDWPESRLLDTMLKSAKKWNASEGNKWFQSENPGM
jgi:hypothetical protein